MFPFRTLYIEWHLYNNKRLWSRSTYVFSVFLLHLDRWILYHTFEGIALVTFQPRVQRRVLIESYNLGFAPVLPVCNRSGWQPIGACDQFLGSHVLLFLPCGNQKDYSATDSFYFEPVKAIMGFHGDLWEAKKFDRKLSGGCFFSCNRGGSTMLVPTIKLIFAA